MKKTELTFLLVAIILISAMSLSRIVVSSKIEVQHVHLDNIQKVIDITDSMIMPVLYDSLIVQSFATTKERKKQFINQVLPAILITKYNLDHQSKKVQRIVNKIETKEELNAKEQAYVDSLMVKFRAKTPENLLVRLQSHPTSLVLAQAAVESGWGSSRFALEGNNLFGIWTTKNDPNVIKSLYDREETSIFVKKYTNIAESIDHYFLTIGRHRAYQQFRDKRHAGVDVFELIDELDKYSEKGEEYTHLLKKMIEWNDLKKYDSYSISEEYIINITMLDVLFNRTN